MSRNTQYNKIQKGLPAMKATLLFTSIMALCLLVIPMIAMNYNIEPLAAGTNAPQVQARTPTAETTPVLEDSYPPNAEEASDEPVFDEEYVDEEPSGDIIAVSETEPVTVFKVLDQTTGKVNEISLRDFIRGAVAAEMPASFHSEALKAQAVAAHTFALHNHFAQTESPDASLKGADFAADPTNMKVYITEQKAKEFYGGGETADKYWSKICEAADSVSDLVLEYDDEPIVAAYHAISSGRTEDASNVWIGGSPYLVSVKSEGDLLAPGYESTVAMTAAEVKAKLTAAYPGIKLSGGESAWFGEITRSDSGYVSMVEVGDMDIAGKELRQIFGLRSHNFEVNYENGSFIFTVTGYGHGVGLSQYGADFLANQGYGFDEILSAYYTDAVLKSVAIG